MPQTGWTLSEWLDGYRNNTLDPETALHALLKQFKADDPAWIYVVSAAQLNDQLAGLARLGPREQLPLYGVPFVVKDNIDMAGLPTTAGCPQYSYTPEQDATSVARLRAAGAILLAKANLDQFATGLVGTRSPYGPVPNSFNPAYVSGGSSSGSAVAVARGLVPFSLGTDTAGSGRVPAGFNNLVGLKPTRGRFSIQGVVPACRSLDCVSVFTLTVDDAEWVAGVLEGFDPADGYSREPFNPPAFLPEQPRLGIPTELPWFGDSESEAAWMRSLGEWQDLGVTLVPLDFTPMQTLAQLLYGGPWVAERHAAIAEFMAEQGEVMDPTVRGIIEQAHNFTATDAYRAEYRRAELTRDIQRLMQSVDTLLVPTSPRLPTLSDVAADPVAVNSQLGTWTNFVNLADCSALALPAGIRADGLPFGITLIGPAWQDAALAELGRRWQAHAPWALGATDRILSDGSAAPGVSLDTISLDTAPLNTSSTLSSSAPSTTPSKTASPHTVPPNYVRLAVVGAHLSGMPLNRQLRERCARFVETTTTASCYRLYALPNTTPPKPGLIRTQQGGAAILVELWDLPLVHFGSFVAEIPAPLGIGTLTLTDGRTVKGFICEAEAAQGATDITALGGWRAYINALTT